MKRQSVGVSTLTAGLIGILSTGVLAFQEQDMNQIQIAITGSEDAEFSANWRVTQTGEVTEHGEERGRVPAEFSFEGSELQGTVTLLTDNERLEVDIQKGTNRSRSSTQGKGGTLTLHIQ